MARKQYTVISIFAGGGGSSLGYKWAGFKELLAIDFDKNAYEVLRLNFDFPIWLRDIQTVTSQEILNFCKINIGELDILDGSPPCQGFSDSGKRRVTDIRNNLFKEYTRLIDGIRPKIFVMENVSGLIKGKMRGIFKEIILQLKSLDYNVKCKLMDAKYYGVPQSRKRLIFIGIRKDLKIEPSFPKSGGKIINVREAFLGLDNQNEEIKFLPEWLKKATQIMIPGNYSNKYSSRIFLKMKGNVGGSRNTKLLSWNRYSCTLLASEIMDTGIIHPDKERYLTLLEYKRLCSFPDDYKLINRKKGIMILGNAVMPKMMKTIAKHLSQILQAKQEEMEQYKKWQDENHSPQI